MGIKITNNATTTLAVGITATDLTVSVVTGAGALFPALSLGDYFYGVIEDASGNYEIVKVTARTADAMTVVRGQEGTVAQAFAAGALFDLRMTAQTFFDYIQSTVGTAVVDKFTSTGTTAPYTLSVAPTAIQQLFVVAGGVVQEPTTDYTVTGTALTPVAAWPAGQTIMAFQFNPTSVLAGALVPADIGVSVQAYDVDTAKTDVAQNFTASQRSAPITDNDLSFDLSGAGNNYTCSFSSSGTLTFTNIAANSGKSGWIKFVVTGTPTVSAHANTKITSANLTRLGAAGTYVASYYCDGTDVYVSVGTYA